jgi:hypothetical protein
MVRLSCLSCSPPQKPFHFHFKGKDNKYLSLKRDQGIHLHVRNLATGTKGTLTGGRFGALAQLIIFSIGSAYYFLLNLKSWL